MSDREWKEESGKELQPHSENVQEQPGSYTYRWDYGEQCAYEQARDEKKKRNGVLIYAVIMTTVFLLCFAMLAGVLLWYRYGSGSGSRVYSGDSLTTVEVAELVNPSTVLIYSSSSTSYGYGTGFFIRSNGYIATNYHVVGEYSYIAVTLYSGETLEAELVGYSEADDLAVLKIGGSGYPVVTIGDSDALLVGEVAIAIGNPSGADAPWTTTQGIISALNREITVTGTNSIEELTMIQTDAPVNPGNSGGPLCNDRGEVIGVVTRKMTDYEGIGLAIPINGAMEILNAIVETGSADGVDSSVSKVRPTIGIRGGDIEKGTSYYDYYGNVYTAEQNGVLVSSVESSGGAAGILMAGDIIIAMDGKTVANMDDLIELLYQHKVGDQVKITVWRDGEELTVTVTLGKAE